MCSIFRLFYWSSLGLIRTRWFHVLYLLLYCWWYSEKQVSWWEHKPSDLFRTNPGTHAQPLLQSLVHGLCLSGFCTSSQILSKQDDERQVTHSSLSPHDWACASGNSLSLLPWASAEDWMCFPETMETSDDSNKILCIFLEWLCAWDEKLEKMGIAVDRQVVKLWSVIRD